MRRLFTVTACVAACCAIPALATGATPTKNAYYEWDSHKSNANFLAYVYPSRKTVSLSYYELPLSSRPCGTNPAAVTAAQGQNVKFRKGKFKAKLRFMIRGHQSASVTGIFT